MIHKATLVIDNYSEVTLFYVNIATKESQNLADALYCEVHYNSFDSILN